MTYSAIFSHASRLREMGNRFILAELGKAGLTDLAPSHGDVLVHLLACETCNMSDLAKRIRRTKSTVTTLVERLPDPTDSRGVLVRLTGKGRALEPAFTAISSGLHGLLAQRLSDEEAALLERLLAKCINA